VSLSAAIIQYISTKYDQHPDMFSTDLSTIESLRNSAINVQEPHSSGVKRLATYAGQLRWMRGKFPVDIGVDFTWYPAMGFNTNKSTSMNNLRFEYANVLYNLAALYSQLAVALNRTTAEGLRTASNYFCQAAGVLEYLRTEAIPDMKGTPPDDMDEMTLHSLSELMLAQAQECFWQKAVKDGLKDASIARLAAKVSDYYSQAGDFGIKSDAVSTEWIHHMTAKHHHFAAAAQYRQSKDCLEKRKYGEEIARLGDSLVCVNDALKESRWINRVVLGDLNGLKNRVQEDLKRAEKDNDVIYLQPVPPKSELKTLDRASMVKARVPDEVAKATEMLGDNAPFGPALFSKLVPYAVHIAASIYVERRDRMVNDNIIAVLEAQTSKLRDLLSSLSLPGSLSAIEKPLGLPPSILSRAETLRQASALTRLHSSIAATATLRSSDITTFNEGIEQLRSEKAEDERLRARYGTDRWSRQKSEEAAAELYRKRDEFQGYFDSAKNTDDLVAKKLRDAENILRILTGSNRDLEAYVPNSRRATLTPKVEREAQNLRSVLNDVSRLETRRKRAIETLKEKAKSDDISMIPEIPFTSSKSLSNCS
jgi:programmed cell death 6-interacting protein